MVAGPLSGPQNPAYRLTGPSAA